MKKLFFTWLGILFIISILSNDANSLTVVAASTLCGLTTYYVWRHRGKIKARVDKWSKSPRKNFIVIGSLGALWAEFLYWFFEKVFGGSGIAATSNLIYDWIATMPWYIILVAIFWQVAKKYKYSIYEVLILGGIYELGADGFLGSVINDRFPELFITGMVGFPIFIITYSSIILIPFMLVDTNPKPAKKVWRYSYALLPLLGLIPYYLFVITVF